jgi:hypothetical protein
MYKKIEWLYIGDGLVYVTVIAYSEGSFNPHWSTQMSQLIKTETKSPTLPKMQSKLFNAFDVEKFTHSLIFGKGLSPADTIRPSDIGMNSHAAKSALGAAVSVPGFISGLAWSLCAIAHGQKKLSVLQEGSACCQSVCTDARLKPFQAWCRYHCRFAGNNRSGQHQIDAGFAGFAGKEGY